MVRYRRFKAASEAFGDVSRSIGELSTDLWGITGGFSIIPGDFGELQVCYSRSEGVRGSSEAYNEFQRIFSGFKKRR